MTLRTLDASYGNVRRAASRQGASRHAKAAIFPSTQNIHRKTEIGILSERVILIHTRFEIYRQIFIIYMIKINFTHVEFSGKT